ncbi:transketolase C-terminal domain-containing protein [Bengtsoniella intestinalis]|uniref:transketolase family protein n=1 Tax=Bengtsoniella intestinalis TaxID=3073143 RepID=UPI00391F6917
MELKQEFLVAKHEKDSRACRDALVNTLNEMMETDKDICYVDCDLMGCVNTKQLAKKYPERAFQAGIAEANAAGVCAGLAATGKKPYVHSFGIFASRRIYDQVYMSAAYAGLGIRVLGSDPGVSAAFNGGTHMPFEDGGMYCSIPEAVVFDPCDYAQLAFVTRAMADIDTVSYCRFVRKDVMKIYDDAMIFEVGKGIVLHENTDDVATIITSGIMVDESLKTYEALQAEGISVRVIDLFTWKPLDDDLVIKSAQETGAVITVENHSVINGLGSAVANCLAQNSPVPQEFVGVTDRFGQVGKQDFLMDEYGLRAENIIQAVKKALARK